MIGASSLIRASALALVVIAVELLLQAIANLEVERLAQCLFGGLGRGQGDSESLFQISGWG